MKRVPIFLTTLVMCAAVSAVFAQDVSLTIDKIYFYNANRIPWYPVFLKVGGIDAPLGADVTIGYHGIQLIPDQNSELRLYFGGGLDEREYSLVSSRAIGELSALGSQSSGAPITPNLAADEAYSSLNQYEDDGELQYDTENLFASEYAQLRFNLGLGLRQQIPLAGWDESPLSLGVDWKSLYAYNIADEDMLSSANDVMEKNQLIFLSEESDRKRYLLTTFAVNMSWDMMQELADPADHGLKDGYGFSVYAEVAPGFLNPSIDPGITSEGIDFDPIEGTNASYYQTGFIFSTARPLFDRNPDSPLNRFSGYIGSNFSLNWFDELGANGRIPLEVRVDANNDDEYLRRFTSEANIGLYTQLPESHSVRIYWNSRLRYLYGNEFDDNPAFTVYSGSGWDGSSYSSYDQRIAIDEGKTLIETEFYFEFWQAFVLGALFRLDLSNTNTGLESGPTVNPQPIFELEVLFP